MGWSLPDIPAKNKGHSWSPWVCLLIIFSGLFLALIFVVLDSSVSGLHSLASGYWSSLILKTITGCLIAITLYTFWWETQAFIIWRWNGWRQNMHLLWLRRAYQHHFITRQVLLTADPHLLPRLAGVASEEGDDKPSLTLLPGERLTPGISRFEQVCRLLLAEISPQLLQKYAGNTTVLVHTSSKDKDAEARAFLRLWVGEKFPGSPDVHILPNELPFEDWNSRVSASKGIILVLAMHYRQPDESLPEFASALLLMPPSLITQSEWRTAPRLFRAMPLNGDALSHELKDWRNMGQQSADKKYLVWHSGLAQAPRQGLSRVLNALPLPLIDDIGVGGIIDFNKTCGAYGNLTGWLMIASAGEMTRYGPSKQLLLCGNDHEGWAITLGDSEPVMDPGLRDFLGRPFPVGSILMALLLNIGGAGLAVHYSPSVAFSWSGMVILLTFLAVTLPGIGIFVRNTIARLLRPFFIKAARQSGKE